MTIKRTLVHKDTQYFFSRNLYEPVICENFIQYQFMILPNKITIELSDKPREGFRPIIFFHCFHSFGDLSSITWKFGSREGSIYAKAYSILKDYLKEYKTTMYLRMKRV